MTISTRNNNRKGKSPKRKYQPLLPTLVAVGSTCGFGAAPVGALELGEIQIDSTLGQPLRASIAYALNPAEQLSEYCIYLRPGVSADGLPAVSGARVSITNNAIVLTGTAPVREPMLGMQVAVDCPHTPRLQRDYTLMVNPAAPPTDARASGEDTTVTFSDTGGETMTPVAVEPGRTFVQPAAPPMVADQSPIAMTTQYRVRPGDSVSNIVARVEGRTIALWPAVDAVFAANPAAFVNNDVNRLKAGTVLDIPNMTETVAATGQSAPVIPATTEVAAPEPVIVAAPSLAPAANTAVLPVEPAPAEAAPVSGIGNAQPVPTDTIVANPTPDLKPSASEQGKELRPGDVIMAPAGSTAAETFFPDTAIGNEAASLTVPVVSDAAQDNIGTSGAWNWLMWLGGSGLVLILGLLLFGRTLRERFGSVAIGSPDAPARRQDDDPTRENRINEDLDFQFEDAVNAQAISLDADLEDGTGLNETEVEVAQDFGFSASEPNESPVDIEFPEEANRENADTPTDIIAPNHRIEESSILEKESPADDNDEEYDFSMIVDATKQPVGYDATAQDLQAVQIDTGSTRVKKDDHTSGDDGNYEVLEQGYEDDLTITQALTLEIEKAARGLGGQMGKDEPESITSQMPAIDLTAELAPGEATVEMPSAEITRELPVAAESDNASIEIPAASDPAITAELTVNLPIPIEAENDAVAGGAADSERTVELSAAGSDVTVEMQLETGKVDTKKKRNKK